MGENENQCAMCGKPDCPHTSDDETCEGCSFCGPDCEVQYIQFLAAELDRDGRNFDYDEILEED